MCYLFLRWRHAIQNKHKYQSIRSILLTPPNKPPRFSKNNESSNKIEHVEVSPSHEPVTVQLDENNQVRIQFSKRDEDNDSDES